MRPYPGISPESEEESNRRDKFRRLDWYLRDLDRAINRVSKGQVPDGSGSPIIDAALSDIYLVLKGRPGNQVAHGGTMSGGKLTLSSTLHPTKGKVYLGEAEGSAYDETNERLGINTGSPAARLHLKAAATTNQVGAITSLQQNSGWIDQNGTGTDAAVMAALNLADDTTYIRHNKSGGTLGVNLTGLSSPGVTTGFILSIRARANAPLNGNEHLTVNLRDTVGLILSPPNSAMPQTSLWSPQVAQLSTSFATYTYTLSAAEVAAISSYSTLRVELAYYTGFDLSQTVDVAGVDLTIPPVGGTLDTAPLQKWENPTLSNTLSYVQDALSNTVLAVSGAPHLAIQASGFDLSIGTPVSGQAWAAQNAVGAGAWAAASGLATKVDYLWKANGFYRTDTEVDGAWLPSASMTLGRVTLYRRQGGSAGSTTVDLLKNGTSVLSLAPAIAFNAGASATASGAISVTTVAAGDRFTTNCTADSGRPRDWTLLVEAF